MYKFFCDVFTWAESSDSETGIVGKMATPGGHSEKEDGDDDNQSVYDGSDL